MHIVCHKVCQTVMEVFLNAGEPGSVAVAHDEGHIFRLLILCIAKGTEYYCFFRKSTDEVIYLSLHFLAYQCTLHTVIIEAADINVPVDLAIFIIEILLPRAIDTVFCIEPVAKRVHKDVPCTPIPIGRCIGMPEFFGLRHQKSLVKEFVFRSDTGGIVVRFRDLPKIIGAGRDRVFYRDACGSVSRKCSYPVEEMLQAQFLAGFGKAVTDAAVCLFGRNEFAHLILQVALEQHPALFTQFFPCVFR